jgi:hypothetical protein
LGSYQPKEKSGPCLLPNFQNHNTANATMGGSSEVLTVMG